VIELVSAMLVLVRSVLLQEGEAGAVPHVHVAHLRVDVPGTDADADGYEVESGHCLYFPAMEPSFLRSVVHLGRKHLAWASQAQSDLGPAEKLARPVEQVSKECEVGHRLLQDPSASPSAPEKVGLRP
jgi:hypothetical protein